jgi:hypothetical protein
MKMLMCKSSLKPELRRQSRIQTQLKAALTLTLSTSTPTLFLAQVY